MRLAGGQVRPVMADRPERAFPPDAGQGFVEIPARDERDAADGQTRRRTIAAGSQRVVDTNGRRQQRLWLGKWSIMARPRGPITMKSLIVSVALAAAMLTAAPAVAPHSANAEFDTQKVMVITGVLTKFEV